MPKLTKFSLKYWKCSPSLSQHVISISSLHIIPANYLLIYLLICIFFLWKIKYEKARTLTRLSIPVPQGLKQFLVQSRYTINSFDEWLATNDFWVMFPQQLETRLLPRKPPWSNEWTYIQSDYYRSRSVLSATNTLHSSIGKPTTRTLKY